MRPAAIALLDQAEAATRHAEAVMRAQAARNGASMIHARPGPITCGIVDRMQNRMLDNALDRRPTLCEHLSYQTPAVAFWPAWAPGKIRCPVCTDRAHRRIRGTREDKRCDHCKRITTRIHPDAAQLPAVVVNLPPFAPSAIPPIIVQYGLCPSCQRVDQHEERQ
jgi:hypothetical protein